MRRGKVVERIPFLCVIGARADNERMEVLAIEVGDREHKELWAELFQSLARRGLQMEAVELGVMDSLPGLEDAFRAAFANADRPTPAIATSGQYEWWSLKSQPNALKRVGKQVRADFKEDINRIFYAANESTARMAFAKFRQRWEKSYPSAVAVIVRDLDSLLRFYQWQPTYWPTLRTTNPIERVNKEFKRRTKAMEITGGEQTTYRLLAYVGLTMNLTWRYYSLSTHRNFYTLQAA